MTSKDTTASPGEVESLPDGAWGYQNWKAFTAGRPETEALEIALYSDRRFVGELGSDLGPYKLLNPVPSEARRDPAEIALVLRVGWHLPRQDDAIVALVQRGRSDLTRYHGGDLYDEIAALISLTHGCRLHAGGVIRDFRLHDDPRGRPRVEEPHRAPNLPRIYGWPVIPRLDPKVVLRHELLATYPKLPWATAGQILRAARSYQSAIWIADADPQLAWLMLVSATETAAAEWVRLTTRSLGSPVDLLEYVHPDFTARLRQAAESNAANVLQTVADQLAEVLRSIRKFLDFLLEFQPPPLDPRPTAFSMDWSPANMRKALSKVYTYRSKALHASEPFPPPMCNSPLPPTLDGAGNRIAFAERPGGSTFVQGGIWAAEDLPMNLYTFEYVVRHSLLRFWEWASAFAPTSLAS